MAIYAKAGATFTPAPEGTHCATCCDVVDLGEQEVTYQGKTQRKHKVAICWQIEEEMDNGKPFLVRRKYTLSLHEKATLRRDLESWRGRAFTDQELQAFDLESLLEVPCLLNVIHETRAGSTFANVAGVMRLPKNMTAPTLRDYVRVQDRPAAQTDGTEDSPFGITDDDVPFDGGTMIHLDPQLMFDQAAHRYTLNGTVLPSVTTVLAAAGLVDYSFLGDRREAYLERGRAVHLATQRDDEGNFADDSVPPEILEYVTAWRRFKRDYGFTPRLIEHRVFHPQLQYAGTLDRLGPVRDRSEWLLDIKTGIAPAAARLQLAAYNGCLPHPRARLRRCVELHQDGAYKVIPFETSDYSRDFAVFAAALELFKTRKEEK